MSRNSARRKLIVLRREITPVGHYVHSCQAELIDLIGVAPVEVRLAPCRKAVPLALVAGVRNAVTPHIVAFRIPIAIVVNHVVRRLVYHAVIVVIDAIMWISGSLQEDDAKLAALIRLAVCVTPNAIFIRKTHRVQLRVKIVNIVVEIDAGASNSHIRENADNKAVKLVLACVVDGVRVNHRICKAVHINDIASAVNHEAKPSHAIAGVVIWVSVRVAGIIFRVCRVGHHEKAFLIGNDFADAELARPQATCAVDGIAPRKQISRPC